MYDIYEKFETTTLPNGLTVHCLHWPEKTGSYFEFIIHSGARQDPVGEEGAAHFMEHLVSENALLPCKKLQRFFEHNAGRSPQLGTTGPNGTYYSFLSSSEPVMLNKSLHYYGHMLLQASLVNQVERERQVIVGEFEREFPMQVKYDMSYRMRQAAFPNTFFGRSLSALGTKATITSLSQKDLQEFYDTNYTPANMSVVVVGELTLADVVKALKDSPFGEHKSGVRTPRPTTITECPFPTETECLFHEGAHFIGRQAASFMSIAQLSGTFSETEIRIVAEMLDKQLFKVVRLEKAWTYAIGCNTAFFGDFHEFSIHCSSLDVSAIDRIANVISDCVEKLRTQTEVFEEIKHKLILTKHYSDPNAYSVARNARNELIYNGRIITLTEELREAEAIQMSDIIPIIDHLADNRRWTMIGHP